uniref:Mothers against decapentaplegic homolog n=1 Tax=Acrobeloides nanus TaxID=290746 RepID=A0A914EKU7_9BILA
MPWDCGFLCLLSDRRRYIEILWRRRLLVTADEKKARRRFNNLMRGFDSEDLDVLRRAVETSGRDIKQCAPGPPMDLVEEDEEDIVLPTTSNRMHRNRHSTTNAILPGVNARYSFIHQDENANTAIQEDEEDDGQQPGGSGTSGLSGMFEDCGLIPQIDRPMSMPYLCCKMWRWKDLQVDAALHKLEPLPWCRFGRVTINNATVSCCNPYHYGLWIRPEHSSSSENPSLAGTGTLANGGVRQAEHSLTNDTGYGDELTGTTGTHRHRDREDLPPLGAPPAVPNATPQTNLVANHLPIAHTQAIAWGRMARWEKKERIGDVVTLIGQFVAVGRLAGTVHDGQDVKCDWDLRNQVSFALMRLTESEYYEDFWLYNSGDKPLFLSVSQSSANQKSDTIRRLSPGYCIRVHRNPLMPESGRTTIRSLDPANSVAYLTISMGIGWGINYQRLYVTDLPCRYEIFLQ